MTLWDNLSEVEVEPNQMSPEQTLHQLIALIVESIGKKTATPIIQFQDYEFTLQVDGKDQGRFIGKRGIVFWALNTILHYAGTKALQRPVKLVLLEPLIPNNDRSTIPFKPNRNWDRQKLKELAHQLTESCVGQDNIRGFELTEPDFGEADLKIKLNPYLKTPCADPNLAEAIDTIIDAAGRADGCSVTTTIKWE